MAIAPYGPRFRPEAFALAQQQIASIDQQDRLIFISVNAVRAFADLQPGPQQSECWAIGKATEAALGIDGWSVAPSTAAMTSEALLSLPDWQVLSGQRIAIVKGAGGRGLLSRSLRDRGAVVTEILLYERQPVLVSDERLRQILTKFTVNCVCVNSAETLAFLQQQWNPTYVDTPLALVVPSQRVASTVNRDWFDPVVVSANAGLDATLEALRAIRQKI